MKSFVFYGKQAIINTDGNICKTPQGMLETELFKEVMTKYLAYLREKRSPLLNIFPPEIEPSAQYQNLIELLQKLAHLPKKEIIRNFLHLSGFFNDTYLLHEFVEHLYNYWRNFERFLICYSDFDGPSSIDKRPWRTFSETIESLNHLIRKTYRDICKNITNEPLSVYRQMPAGCQVSAIAVKKDWPTGSKPYDKLKDMYFIRQILIEPPLILDPPMNKRSGQFKKVDSNPLDYITLNKEEWLCYPAKVGELVIHIFFHKGFIGLGSSLINLFDIANDKELNNKPDAIYLYGVPEKQLKKFGSNPTIFYDDEKNKMLCAAVPLHDKYGYFGYLKKMLLTLHNIIMMKRGRLPVHGSMVKIELKNGKHANIIILGDTGTGKSESLEAFSILGDKYIRDMKIIFDDMGSLEITEDNRVRAYGTETGAFVRLDDLSPEFTFGNVDRSIIMSPQKINARAVLPITTLKEVLHGYEVDYLLYANNYEEIDNKHPFFEEFKSKEEALLVFREGKRMAKGTTTETGLVKAYFANIFGPVQYKSLHERLAKKYFVALFHNKTIVGQLRTRLGIPGFETKGPQTAAEALFKEISRKS